MMSKMRNLVRSEKGQGMTEYIIIVALIAIAAIAVITVFSQNIRALFAASANELAGSQMKSGTSAGGCNASSAGVKKMNAFGSQGSN
jgi:pilus assembly protein Flp/PilA